jgi:hypothetical protein
MDLVECAYKKYEENEKVIVGGIWLQARVIQGEYKRLRVSRALPTQRLLLSMLTTTALFLVSPRCRKQLSDTFLTAIDNSAKHAMSMSEMVSGGNDRMWGRMYGMWLRTNSL